MKTKRSTRTVDYLYGRDLELEKKIDSTGMGMYLQVYSSIVEPGQHEHAEAFKMLQNWYPKDKKVIFPWVCPRDFSFSDRYINGVRWFRAALENDGYTSHLVQFFSRYGDQYEGGYFVIDTGANAPQFEVVDTEVTEVIRGAFYMHSKEGWLCRCLGLANTDYTGTTNLPDNWVVYQIADERIFITSKEEFNTFKHLPQMEERFFMESDRNRLIVSPTRKYS